MIDDEDLQKFLAYGAIESTELFLAPDTPPVTSVNMENFCQLYWQVLPCLARSTHYYPKEFVDALLVVDPFPVDKKTDQPVLQRWCDQVAAQLELKEEKTTWFITEAAPNSRSPW